MPQLDSPSHLAKAFLEIVPRTMWAVRAEVRQAARKRSRGALSVPQIRVLAQLARQPHGQGHGMTNGELAERLGVTVPSMSRLVDGLARKGLLTRDVEARDRRRVALKLSRSGLKYFHTVMKSVE